MQKKVLLLPAFVGVLLSGCSDDSSDRNPIDANSVPIIGEQSDSLPGLDPNIPYVDPVSGDTVAVPATPPLSSGAIAIPTSSATAQLPVNQDSTPEVTPATSVSSAAQPVSSSSGLKDYEDNHKPKESFLPKAGFYSNLTIEPPTPQKGGEIRCTFDGSFPTQGSEQITQTKQITENTVIRCSEFVNGLPADTTTQTYFINETVSMPVVALTVNHHDMFDSTDGLYATGPLTNNGESTWDFGGNANVTDNNNPRCTEPCKAANFWKDTELPVHVEYFEKGSSTTEKTWEIDAGISIIGNYSRYKPKKSVAIKMDNDNYGDKVLKYSLFTTRPEAKKIKSFNLRNNGNRFWTDYIGDAMMTSLMEGTDVDYQRSRQVVVFYNGEYFGIHDLRERLNRSYVETNYGIDSKSINMIKIAGSNLEASGTNGASTGDYQQLVNEISSANYAGENNQQYEQLKTKMNVNSFAQYMLTEMYFHNGDWPNNNVRAWGGNGNPFKYVAFDTDHGFGFTPGIANFDVQNQNMFDWVLGAKQGATQNPGQGGMWGGFGGGSWGATDSRTPGGMLKKLLDNPDFRRLFINNACILLNDYLTYEKVQKTVQAMMATIPSQEQSRDQERWPRNQSNFTWDPSGSTLIAYARNRSETVRQEMADRFDLQNEVNVTIAASGNGTIKVDGMKLPSANYQGKFFAGMQMQLEALPAAGRIFSGWSDGSTENPRLVEITDNMNITAQFK
ncbi:CotH kinase family protein [Fibrobacter sp. UWH4]|uniref:CotH kinase family protein n=1 Tax=Fibrobacter sp. UWH4 TaxID=1896210 RepID=UPI0009195331|nr:CotH kinase family protein [Fibrobacter sp. UWH4]SHL76408.1 Chitobiase/beta-hexosaminidase C-terminal domain-containing protein [Fibrobacter sp. UWH4]